MNKLAELVDRYIAVWNEVDAKCCLKVMARTWTEDAHYRDSLARGDKQGGIAAMNRRLANAFPTTRCIAPAASMHAMTTCVFRGSSPPIVNLINPSPILLSSSQESS